MAQHHSMWPIMMFRRSDHGRIIEMEFEFQTAIEY